MEMTHASTPNPMAQVLAEMNREARFPASTLSGKDGLLVASHTENGDDPQRQSAVVAKLNEAARMAHAQLAIGAPEELSFYAEDGRRLVCRPFQLKGYDFILSVLVPTRGQPHRRATTRAIARLRELWEQG
jgi:predicted regulator of Ras-like GTPase activity (Roadblock/LC7/MglB family)